MYVSQEGPNFWNCLFSCGQQLNYLESVNRKFNEELIAKYGQGIWHGLA